MELDTEAIQATKQVSEEPLDTVAEVPVWMRDDAPPGSTEGSLLVYERGRPVRVSGPTHYQHLVDGRVIPHYNGGTHYSEPGDNGRDKITKILSIHEG